MTPDENKTSRHMHIFFIISRTAFATTTVLRFI